MKPDGVLTGDMEECEIEPNELFYQLGMLVVEARLPEKSTKGRTEGPHCPKSKTNIHGKHVCDQLDKQCKLANYLRNQIQLLWKNKIPMCIEVLMYPECEHGSQKVQNADSIIPGSRDSCLLLEQWTIQVFPHRGGDNLSSVRVLFQAIKSYLHFSQLSAWLNLTQGKIPRNVAFRISPPGEFCTSSFQETPLWHTFPITGANDRLAFKVTMGALPRYKDVILVPCTMDSYCTSSYQTNKDKYQTFEKEDFSKRQVTQGQDQAWSPTRYPTQVRTKPCTSKHSPDMCPNAQGSSPSREESHTRHRLHGSKSLGASFFQNQPTSEKDIQIQKRSGAIPKRPPAPHTPPGDSSSFDHHAKSSPQLDNPSLSNAAPSEQSKPNSKAQSPKVLFTHMEKGHVYQPKDIESTWPLKGILRDYNSTDSDQSSPEIDKCLRTLNNKFSPMSPKEMEAYLSSLANKAKSKKAVISPLEEQVVSREHLALRNSVNGLSYHSTSNGQHVMGNQISDANDNLENVTNGKSVDDIMNNLTISGPQKPTTEDNNNIERLPQGKVTDAKGKMKSSLTKQLERDDNVKFTIGDDEDVDNCTNGVVKAPKRSPPDQLKLSPPDGQDGKDKKSNTYSKSTSPVKDTHRAPPFSTKSLSQNKKGAMGFSKSNPLIKSLVKRDLMEKFEDKENHGKEPHIPTEQERATFRRSMNQSTNAIFHAATGLPMQSSPAPLKRITSSSFDYDDSLTNVRAIKNSLSCVNLDEKDKENSNVDKTPQKYYSTSAPASTNCLLGNFEESLLNGRIEPTGVVDGFTAEIGASGSFCPRHVNLPVTAFFFNLSDDNAPSPYLGHINLESLGKRGYHVPKQGTVQVTLFNPNKAVVKMFVVRYDLGDMPSNCQTFLRQRTLYMPVKGSQSDLEDRPIYLRYLIHLRFTSSKTGKIYLHTDIRLIFARDKFEYDSRVENYELRSFTEGPVNPKFSPKR